MTDFNLLKDLFNNCLADIPTWKEVQEEFLSTLYSSDWDYCLSRHDPDLIKDTENYRNSIIWC